MTTKGHILATRWMSKRRYKGKQVVRPDVKDWLNKHVRGRWYLYVDKIPDLQYSNMFHLTHYFVFEELSDLLLFKLTWMAN